METGVSQRIHITNTVIDLPSVPEVSHFLSSDRVVHGACDMPTTPVTNRPGARGRRHQTLLWCIGAFATAFPLVIGAMAWKTSGGDPLAWVPAHPSTLMTILLLPIMACFSILYNLGYIVGTGILAWNVRRLMLRDQKPVIPPAILIPLLCDVYVFAQALPFFEVPRGEQIRPMGWSAITLLLAFSMTIYGVSYAVRQLRAQENKIICAVGILVGLLPYPIMLFSLNLVAAIKGFRLEP